MIGKVKLQKLPDRAVQAPHATGESERRDSEQAADNRNLARQVALSIGVALLPVIVSIWLHPQDDSAPTQPHTAPVSVEVPDNASHAG